MLQLHIPQHQPNKSRILCPKRRDCTVDCMGKGRGRVRLHCMHAGCQTGMPCMHMLPGQARASIWNNCQRLAEPVGCVGDEVRG